MVKPDGSFAGYHSRLPLVDGGEDAAEGQSLRQPLHQYLTGNTGAPGLGRCFLQAEDGIRHVAVTGVQTCALPISNNPHLTKSAFEQIGAQCESQMGVFPEFARRITSHAFHGVYLQALVVRADIIKSMGGFHAALTVNEDTDFLFHLAQRTNICYVNIPLVEIDRTPHREIGLTELRTKESYRLKMAQYMYEKWLSEYKGVDLEIRTRIQQRLHDIH